MLLALTMASKCVAFAPRFVPSVKLVFRWEGHAEVGAPATLVSSAASSASSASTSVFCRSTRFVSAATRCASPVLLGLCPLSQAAGSRRIVGRAGL